MATVRNSVVSNNVVVEDGAVAHLCSTEGREVVGRRSSGETFPMDLAVNDVRLPDGRQIFVGLVRDISERRELEQAVLRAAATGRSGGRRDLARLWRLSDVLGLEPVSLSDQRRSVLVPMASRPPARKEPTR